MINVLLVLAGGGLLLLGGEFLNRRKKISKEEARKFVHICFGVYVSLWPYVVDRNQLIFLAGLLLPAVIFSHVFHVFKAIHTGKERLVGEVLYAVSILLVAITFSESWMFTTSILVLALGDGMAALFGKRHGHRSMKLYGNKTLIGALACYVCTLCALAVGYLLGGSVVMGDFAFVVFIWLPLVLTAIELFSPWGIDNLLMPLFAVLVLRLLASA